MIKLSIKSFAMYMVANSSKQRKILHDYKYPNPEGRAQITYYREARECIKEFYQYNHEKQWLLDKALYLYAQANASSGQTKTRLKHNSRALRLYTRYFSTREFDLQPDLSLELDFNGVIISVFPDLHVNENNKEKIIKLVFLLNNLIQKYPK